MPKPCLIQMEGTRRDPENCAKFSRCMNVGGEFLEITFDCPNSTIYSESKNICDYPDNVPEPCETSAAMQSTTASTDLKASDQSATTSATTSADASAESTATTSATTGVESSAATSPAADAAASATTSAPLEATDKSKCVQRARRSERRSEFLVDSKGR